MHVQSSSFGKPYINYMVSQTYPEFKILLSFFFFFLRSTCIMSNNLALFTNILQNLIALRDSREFLISNLLYE